MNFLNAITVSLARSLTVISMGSLLVIVKNVAIQTSEAESRVSLALPLTGPLSYYDSCLLNVVLTVLPGFLLTLDLRTYCLLLDKPILRFLRTI